MVLIIDGNPAKNVSDIRKVQTVFKHGVFKHGVGYHSKKLINPREAGLDLISDFAIKKGDRY